MTSHSDVIYAHTQPLRWVRLDATGYGLPVDFEEIVEHAGEAVDGLGVATIVVGVVGSLGIYGRERLRDGQPDPYTSLRRRVARSILLGLEFLIAGDIIRTVAVSATFQSVGVLAAIVVIRTFLSLTLEGETSGRWPWQSERGR